jgi:gluconolactonase
MNARAILRRETRTGDDTEDPKSVRSSSDGLGDLVDSNSRVERLATGFSMTEGPIWMPDGSLHFSDMPDDKRRRWHSEDGVSVIRDPSNRCNGMTRDSLGGLLVCEHVTSRVVREAPDGSSEVVASHYRGKELNSPNDVIVASDDSVLFTDPDYGRTYPPVGLERPVELDFRGVYRVAVEGGEPQLLMDDFGEPNGLCFSPDESLLYVNDTSRAHIRVFDVGSNYQLSNGRVFAGGIGESVPGSGLVDGMKADERGNVYVTGPRGIWIFDPSGRKLGEIEVPDETTNLNWGDEDWRTLYITAHNSIYRMRMNVAGNRLTYMT